MSSAKIEQALELLAVVLLVVLLVLPLVILGKLSRLASGSGD